MSEFEPDFPADDPPSFSPASAAAASEALPRPVPADAKWTPEDVLQHVFGYAAFRGRQAEVIATAVAGRDALVLMPTGAGKSLCYQIPALLRPGTGLVISPLIALMADQVLALKALGVRAEFLNSTLPVEVQRSIVGRLRRGELDLLYLAPERLLGGRGAAELAEVPLSLIAIDEAHCVSLWGHDFRVDYLALHRLAELFPGVPRMALTATADLRSREEIAERLALTNPARFVTSFDRPNIHYRVCVKDQAPRQLEAFLAEHIGESGIVYCGSRRRVEETAERLAGHGYQALPYHAGLAPEVRAAHQDRFLREEAVVMVATVAFGMGIDKPDVRFVVHLDPPRSLEAYYQETGRAGRDGLPAESMLLYGLQDLTWMREMVEQSESPPERKRVERDKLEALLAWFERPDCRRHALLEYFGETREGACGHCDNCDTPPETFDASVPAQKIMSAIARTGQRFGAGHVIDVLLGKQTERVGSLGHAELSVFGIGGELDARGWRGVVRQLVAQGLVQSDPENFQVLKLTEAARPVLRGEARLVLRKELARVARTRGAGTAPVAPDIEETDRPLWEALRQCRRALAEAAGVPPYVVFHDATLRGILAARPRTLGALRAVSGVGDAKLERYGQAFLEVIEDALD